MTAPPAWPEADETTLLDAADAFDADQKAVDEQLWVFQQGRSRLFEDDVWSGQAANAAPACDHLSWPQLGRCSSRILAPPGR